MSYNRTPCVRQNYEAAMTFEEIAHVLGINKSTVQFTYVNAMRKLMDDPKAFRAFMAMRETVALRESLRTIPMNRLTIRNIRPLAVSEMEIM